MASIPARRPSQRRPSVEQSPASVPQSTPSPAIPESVASEKPKPIFLDNRATEQTEHEVDEEDHTSQTLHPDEDPNVKKCWICFADSTEDTPETSPWRDPCPCALVAHEECLLDWIADVEAPKSSRGQPLAGPKIECPQCKSEIRLARPRDFVVEAVRSLERLGARLVTPGALAMLSGSLYQASMAWGMHSIYAIFGPDDGFRILRPLILNLTRAPVEVYINDPRQAAEKIVGVLVEHLVHWRLYVGLPLITPVLILSRTRYADAILSVLPIVFFATQSHGPMDPPLNFGDWPPSASMCFALLPYLRSAYNFYYEKVWAEKEKQWLKEIQPRSTQNQPNTNAAAGDGGGDPAPQAGDGEEVLLDLRIDGAIWEEWDEPAPPPLQPPREQAPQPNVPLGQAPLDVADAPQQANAEPVRPNAQPRQPAAAPAANNNGERRLSFSPTAIAETVLGAILFPTIAGLSGEVLKLLLPPSWTMPPATSAVLRSGLRRSPLTSILQARWGRSIVGGCLFVVAKDAIMLYVRWRMAEMHRRRRIVEYDRRNGRAR